MAVAVKHSVIVVGATGNVGLETTTLLAEDGGVNVYAATRSMESSIAAFIGIEGIKHVALDLTKPNSFGPALAAAKPDRMLLVRPPQIGDPSVCTALLDAAVQAGVKHVVFLSVQGAGDNKMVPHHAIEKHLEVLASRSAVTYTFIRPSFFMQNMTGANHLPDIRDRGVIDVPAGGGATSFVDARDVGAVAAAVLLAPEAHANKAYTITGSKADVLTYDQVATILSNVCGRPIRYGNPTSLGFACRQRKRGTPWAFIGVMCAIYGVCWLGKAGDTTDDTRRILCREPRSFQQFAEDVKSRFAASAPA